MSIAIREQVVRAFVALLGGLVDRHGDVVLVERGRDTAVSVYPALVVEEGAEQARESNHQRLELRMTLTVFGYLEVVPDEGEIDKAGADYEHEKTDLYARVVRAVLSGDRHLGGLADDIRFVSMTPDIEFDAGAQAGTFTAVFEVDYWTSDSDPFTQQFGG